MNKEKEFLEAQQARVSIIERSQHRQHADSLHAFWTCIRAKLSTWDNSLAVVQEKATNNGQFDHQQLQDLKEELQQLRKHCLGSTVCFDDFDVPDLPVADLRLLHNEFSKYFTKWESVKEIIAPKGKFTFQRYREEVARRKAQGIPLSTPHAKQINTAPKVPQQQEEEEGSCLQNMSNASIHIDSDGNVLVNGEYYMTVTAAALLLRNLIACDLVICKPIVTLHIVQTSKTKVSVQESSRAIHVTDCHGCELRAGAQQLRLHESTDLECHVQVAAGAILEDCTRLVFYNNCIEVKDFNWLRTGVPSPNFQILPPPDSTVGEQAEIQGDTIEQISSNTIDKKEEPIIATNQRNPVESTPPNNNNDVKTPLIQDDDDEDDEL